MNKYCKCQTNTSSYRLETGELLCCECDKEVKENLEPQMIRIKGVMKFLIQTSADKYNEGNFNREMRDLIQIGLKNRKRGEKKINTD